MNKEQEKLLKMFQDRKISESDYQLLSQALNKESLCTQLENSLFVNPFQKIAGFKALFLGLILMVILSVLGVYSNVYFDGILGVMYAEHIKAMKPNFLLLMYQNGAAVLVLASLFLASALILRQKRIRVIDFFGTVAMSRYPLLIWFLYNILEKNLFPPKPWDYSTDIELHFSITGTVGYFFFIGAMVGQIITSFFAYKESSGIEGKKLWISFICTILIGEMIGFPLTRWFLYS